MAAGSSCHCRKSAFSLAAGSPPCSRAVPGTGGSEAQAEPILPPWQRPRLPEQLRSGERLTCAGVRRSRRARAPPWRCSRCRERPPALPPLRSAVQRVRLRTVGISRIRGKLLEGQKDCPQELAYAVPLEGGGCETRSRPKSSAAVSCRRFAGQPVSFCSVLGPFPPPGVRFVDKFVLFWPYDGGCKASAGNKGS